MPGTWQICGISKIRQIMNEQFSTACGTSKGKSRSVAVFAAAALSFFLVQSAACADGEYYGTVESFGDGAVVIKTTKHSTGHWKVDDTTKVTSPVKEADWVFVKVETSGHVTNLRFEERPTIHSGVIQKIHDNVLTVHSGPNFEDWNLKETTILSGIARADLAVGDEIGVKLYKNHNLAEIRVIKSGVK